MARSSAPALQRGFTLIELTIGIVLMGILLGTGANMLSDSLSLARMSNRAHAHAASARYAMERLSRELRGVHYDSGSERFDITIAAPTHMAFAKSGVVGPLAVDIQHTAGALYLAYPPMAGQVLIDHVSAFTLDYKDASMVSTQDLLLIRFVELSMTLTPPDSPPSTLRTLVAWRGAW
jgi:prepilin-type N-terminal cleavage/methylation domain-containing protein